MQLSIHSRIVAGFLLLFLVTTGVTVYSLFLLERFNTEMRSIIFLDTTVKEHAQQLSLTLLSATRHDRKYSVLKDDEVYANYEQARDEFSMLLAEAMSQKNSMDVTNRLSSIKDQFQVYSRLVSDERSNILAANQYSEEWYAEKKQVASDSILESLKSIRDISEINVLEKVVDLSEKGDRVRQVFFGITIFALSSIFLISLIITRSIKAPLDKIHAKTIDISKGNFSNDLTIASPPEIAELAQALNTMCGKLQEIDDIKTDFFAHMSHELRTPLTSIKEGSAMLIEGVGGEVSEQQHKLLSIVTEESNRLIKLINSLLDLLKMEAGMLPYQFTVCKLSDVVERALETLSPLAKSKKITIVNLIETNSYLRLDQERLLEVFQNIMGNGIKFTPAEGTVSVKAYEKNNMVKVEISDTGKGIPEEELEYIFMKFHQLPKGRSESKKGTGLGLAIVQQIIHAHGGEVWATSQLGKGATFHFTLPLAYVL